MEEFGNHNRSARNQEPIHLTELLQVLKLRRKVVYFFVAMTLAGTVFREIVYVPTYPAVATMTVQKAENSPMQLALANLGATQGDNPERLQKYLSYLSSSEFFLAVAETLKFQEGYHLLNLTSPGELGITRKKFWVQFLSSHFGRRPTASTQANPEPVLVPVETLAGIVASMISAEMAGSDTIRLRVSSLDPLTSMVLANTASNVFVKKTGERDFNEVAEVKRFIEQQLEGTTDRLKRSELALVEFKKRHNIISITAEHSAFSTKISAIDGEYEGTKLKLEENQRLIDYYSKALAKNEKSLLANGSASITASSTDLANRIRQQLDSLRYKKVLMQAQGYTEDSWQMGEINRDIDKATGLLKEQLAATPAGSVADDEPVINLETARRKLEQLRAENKGLGTKLNSVERSRADLLKSLGGLPKDEQVLLTLTRDVDLQFELYSSLKKKLQEVEIQQVALQSHVLIGQRADLPAASPRTSFMIKLMFALLVGVFLGGSVAFMLEAIDGTVKHRSDLEALELITLGSLPHVEGSPIRKTLGGQTYRPDLLIAKEKPESPEAMAFKHLRTQLTMLHASDGKAVRVITITSPERGDGKSFISANLAVSMAQLEKRTVLIDADFRNPSQPWLFGYQDGTGLSALLGLKCSLDEALIRDAAPGLDILPTGWMPTNPTELISNDKFRVLIEHLKTQYDYIVIDAPPAVAVVDACVLSSISDCTILAAAFRRTRKDMMVQALRKIMQITHKQVYAVLNNVWELHEYTPYVYPTATQTMQGPGDVDARVELLKFEQNLRKKKAG